jgi:hypothetical protein
MELSLAYYSVKKITYYTNQKNWTAIVGKRRDR